MNVDIEKLNNIARDFNDYERARMSERRINRYWRCASSAIANKILRRLRVLNISFSDFAAMINIEEEEVEKILDGKTNFDLKTLIAIERAIDVHIIDQEVIPQRKISNDMAVNVEYKVIIPLNSHKSCDHNDLKDGFTSIADSLGNSEKYMIYG